MKKINIEAQCLCNRSRQIRGIEYLTLELMNSLVKRGNNVYSASFFDYDKERNNRELLESYFSSYGFPDSFEMYECNTLDYREVIRAWDNDDEPLYAKKSYEEYIHSTSDIYYFPHTVTLPANLPYDKTIVTVCDILHLRNEHARRFHPQAAAQIERIVGYIKKRKDIHIVAISESTKKDLVDYIGIDESRIDVVLLAYNKKMFWPENNAKVLEKFGIKQPYILYLGGLDAHKGLDVLCEAFDTIYDKDVSLVLAGGKCDWYDMEPVISSMRDPSRVILTGYVSDEEKRALMSMSEMFVFPSFYEGFGLPLIEAMACGTPVIASNATSLPEVGGEAALYFDAGDVGGLKERIESLLHDSSEKELRREMSLIRAEQFSWDITAENMERVFEEYAKNKG